MTSSRFSPLLDALSSLREKDPSRGVDVLCMPGARDDVVIALGEQSSLLDVRVMTLGMYRDARGVELAPRVALEPWQVQSTVSQLLENSETKFAAAGVEQAQATHRELARIVWELLSLPAQWRSRTESKELAEECVRIAALVEQQLCAPADPPREGEGASASATEQVSGFFTPAQAWEQALVPPQDRAVFAVGLLALNAPERFFLDNAAFVQHIELASVTESRELLSYAENIHEATAAVEAARAEILAGTPAHRVAIAYANERALPDLRRAFGSMAAKGPVTARWSDLAVPKAALSLATLAPERPHPVALHEALFSGAVTWTDEEGAGPSLVGVDMLTRSQAFATAEGGDSPTGRWVAALQEDVRRLHEATTYAQAAEALSQLCAAHLSPRGAAAADPGWAVLQLCLQRLRGMSGPLGHRGVSAAVQVFSDMINSSQPPTEAGVGIGPLSAMVGRDLDRLIIVDATDAVLPRPVRPEPAFSWAQRDTDPARETAAQREVFEQACASARRVSVSFARTHVDGSVGRPSHWIADSPIAVPGGTSGRWAAQATTLQAGSQGNNQAAGPESEFLPTGAEDAAAITGTLIARRAAAARETTDQESVPEVSVPQVVADAARSVVGKAHAYAATTTARESGAVGDAPGAQRNGFAGTIEAFSDPEMVVSASMLGQYLYHPQSFFLQRGLGARLMEDIQDEDMIDPRARGDLFHRIAEAYTRQVWLDSGRVRVEKGQLVVDQPDWEQARAVLEEITDEHLAEAFAEMDQPSEMTKQALAREIHSYGERFFEFEKKSAGEGWVPVGAEVRFGPTTDRDGNALDDAARPQLPDARLPLADGTSVRIVGSIDRVDVHPSKGKVRVIDYKTGSNPEKKSYGDTAEVPAPSSVRLQVPFYLMALLQCEHLDGVDPTLLDVLRAVVGDKLDRVDAADLPGSIDRAFADSLAGGYIYIKETGSKDRRDIHDVEERTATAYSTALTAVMNNIRAGQFPALPVHSTYGYGPRPETLRLGAAAYAAAADAAHEQLTAELTGPYAIGRIYDIIEPPAKGGKKK